MDKEDEVGRKLSCPPADAAFALTEAQRTELSRRSKAHRRDPGQAEALEDVLELIQRSLGD